jgi:hypothetical protein
MSTQTELAEIEADDTTKQNPDGCEVLSTVSSVNDVNTYFAEFEVELAKAIERGEFDVAF